MIEILSNKTLKANKVHRCNYCGLAIPKGETYENSTLKYDDIYRWKNHIDCREIANKLHMFEYADEGVTGEFFYESITEEYSQIMSDNFNEQYESKDFKVPEWKDQLSFVKDWYKDKEKPRNKWNIS